MEYRGLDNLSKVHRCQMGLKDGISRYFVPPLLVLLPFFFFSQKKKILNTHELFSSPI